MRGTITIRPTCSYCGNVLINLILVINSIQNACRELDEEKAKAAKEKEMKEKKKREPLKPTQVR